MHPIERLRWIARSEDEADSTVAAEAAWALGELALEEEAAVLTASRRLVLRQPASGPLWWACATILEALGGEDVLQAAQRVAFDLAGDSVSARLTRALRQQLAAGDLLGVAPPAETAARALADEQRFAICLLAPYRELRYEMARFGTADVTGYEVEEADEVLEEASLLLVEPRFASPRHLFVSAGAARAVGAAQRAKVACWAVLGPGRVLSEPLAATASQLARGEGELLPPSSFEAAIDAQGLGEAAEVLGRGSCPPALALAHLGELGR